VPVPTLDNIRRPCGRTHSTDTVAEMTGFAGIGGPCPAFAIAAAHNDCAAINEKRKRIIPGTRGE